MNRGWKAVVTFLVAMTLMAFPLPGWVAELRPHWVMLVWIYWSLKPAPWFSMTGAFAIGVVLDLLMDTPLGTHALPWIFLTYVLSVGRRYIEWHPLFQQGLIVLAMVLVERGLLLWIAHFSSPMGVHAAYFLSALTSALLWPWVFGILRLCDRERLK